MKRTTLFILAIAAMAFAAPVYSQQLLYQWAFTNSTDNATNSSPSVSITPGTGVLNLVNVSGISITNIGADGVNPLLYFTNAGAGPSAFSPNSAITNLAAGALVANGQGYSGGNTGIALATNLNLGNQFQLTVTFWFQLGPAVGAGAEFPRFVQFAQTPAFDIGGKGSGNHNMVGGSINGFVSPEYNQEQNGLASASGQELSQTITNIPAGAPILPTGFVCDGQTWYFEAISYDGTQTTSNFITWIGTLSNSVVPVILPAALSSISFTTNATVMIGGNDVNGNARGLAQGAIADVRFYSGVLSQSNVDNVRQFLPIVATNSAGIPHIVAQPVSGKTFVGGSRTFSVGASGSPTPFGYQWQTNSVAVPGATNATLTVNNAQLAANGTAYSVTVSNLVGATNSAAAIFTVLSPASQGAYAAAVVSNNPSFFWLINEPSNSVAVPLSDYESGNDGLAQDPANMAFTNGVSGPSYPGFLPNNRGIEEIIRGGTPSRLNLGDPGTFNNSGMTITGWIFMPGVGGAGNNGAIFDRVSDTAGGFGLEFAGATTLPDGTSGTLLTYEWGPNAEAGFASPLAIPTNQWTFIALVIGTNNTPDTNATLYVGAQSLGLQSASDSTANTGDLIASGSSANILALGRDTVAFSENGGFSAGTTAIFNDVAIFNSALSPSTITNLYITGAGIGLTEVLDVNNPGNILLTYPLGTLQSATVVTGPYTDVVGANTPYSVPINHSASQVYFRVRN